MLGSHNILQVVSKFTSVCHSILLTISNCSGTCTISKPQLHFGKWTKIKVNSKQLTLGDFACFWTGRGNSNLKDRSLMVKTSRCSISTSLIGFPFIRVSLQELRLINLICEEEYTKCKNRHLEIILIKSNYNKSLYFSHMSYI